MTDKLIQLPELKRERDQILEKYLTLRGRL